MDINEWVALSVKHNASDLHLCTGHPPIWRQEGSLRREEAGPPLSAAQLAQWCDAWLDAGQRQALAAHGQLDTAFTLPGGPRFRAHLFHQSRGLSAALRPLPVACPTPAALGVPPVLLEWVTAEDGLILVTGATGSGKSTTLAALVGHLNHHHARHIITLEDPIEFLHVSERCLIQQREVGQHCASFAQGLRGALREDPDVILLGELRDAESIRLALTAAETGHLVLATLHTRSAAQAVDRLVDVFPAEEKAFARAQLAGSLRAVVAQTLCATAGGGRSALCEVLAVTPAVSNLIREGKTHQLPGLLQTGAQAGMQTFAQHRKQREADGVIFIE
ncbi:type IV pilus twitching motility protein PilT [Chimaeribacter arupi]|uniref:type IV pilus twitching motility protein PilT n=1 Tax=Chimaeribacter arupi TaxID=2060066 RepID=UPI000C7B770D|nr:type IV pilus twitching motility protein PilT [Chimaeribacter arupi]PLR29745.1 type IV pili twitching motility protein PilT [Chimaeribacter arupi]PLR50978.1 type IV pili twitching motility protein PilT [Chimaeribacter arupi]